jgi:hypothetical protein
MNEPLVPATLLDDVPTVAELLEAAELLGIELDEDSAEELETAEELLDTELDEDSAEELETAEELLELSLKLLEETSSELELLNSSGGKGGGGISRSEVQEKSSEAQSTAARVIEQGKCCILGKVEKSIY